MASGAGLARPCHLHLSPAPYLSPIDLGTEFRGPWSREESMHRWTSSPETNRDMPKVTHSKRTPQSGLGPGWPCLND